MDPQESGSASENSLTVYQLLLERLASGPHDVAIELRHGDSWQPLTVTQFVAEIVAVAQGLIASGIEPGDRVAIMLPSCYEWTLLDYAIGAAGAISVPIYESSSAAQIRWICQNSGARQVFVADAQHRDRVVAVVDFTVLVSVIGDGAVAQLQAAGVDIPADEIDRRQQLIHERDIPATIVYTSGTTGQPKGVVLTHGNFTDACRAFMADTSFTDLNDVFNVPGRRTLLFLPLAHVLARFVQIFALSAQTTIGHCPDTKDLMSALATFQPTFLLAVPRVLEKVYAAAEEKAGRGLKLRIFRRSVEVAVAYSEAVDSGRPPVALRFRRRLYNWLIYRNLRKAVGGAVKYLAVGGASLNARLGHFFRGAGFIPLEGYGLTETTGSIFGNLPAKQRMGTVGWALKGVSVKIAADGEVLVKGPSVFPRYHNNPAATAAAFTHDGWFQTGDLGELNDDGSLHITGRKKDIIITAGGKNIAPGPLEDDVRSHSLIDQAIVIGDGRNFVAAMVTIARDAIPAWAKQHDFLPDLADKAATFGQATQDKIREIWDTMREEIQKAVIQANTRVSSAEAIKRLVILLKDNFTEENECLTPSLKPRRGPIMSRFANAVEAVYDSGRPVPNYCVIVDVER